MPFKSEKQRKWMHANKPKMAKKWEKEESVDEFRIPSGEQKLVYQFKGFTASQMDELHAMLHRAGIVTTPDFNRRTITTHANRDAMKIKKNKTIQRFIKSKGGKQIKESINEAMSESQRFKVYNSLKKGDIVSIKYDSSIQKGTKYIPYVVTKGKTKLMKGKIERIILKNPSNPRFKAYLYNRDGDVSLALGDMAASIVDMKKGKVKESVFDLDEACQKGYMTHPTRKTKIMFGKRYRNCVKKEGVDTTMTMEQAGMIADNICVNCGDFTNENLKKWFSDRWVNIGKKKKGGGHPPCGSSGKKRGYAKCVPASKAANMSKKQKASATRRKRAAQNKAGRGGTSSLSGGGKKPIRVSTKPKK